MLTDIPYQLRTSQKAFCWNAAPVQTGASQLFFLNKRHRCAQLGCADRAFITARPRSDHKDIKINSICHQAPHLKKDPDRILNE